MKFLLFLVSVLCWGQPSVQQILVSQKITSSAACTIACPGDIVSGASAYWGLRAYSAAKRGQPLINVCNVSDVVCADMVSDATTGDLVVGLIGGSNCSIVTCTIKTFYDGTQGTFCTTACNLTQATIANRFVLVLSCIGTRPCFRGSSASSTGMASPNVASTLSQPYTIVDYSSRTGNTSAYGVIFTANSGNSALYYQNAPNLVNVFFGNSPGPYTLSDSNFHSLQLVANSSSSTFVIDGSTSTIDVGTNGITSGVPIYIFQNSASDYTSGDGTEIGLWPSAFSGGNLTAMASNQVAYWQ